MDSKEIIREFNDYVDCFVECCESDKRVHELLKAVAKLIEDQEERIAIVSPDVIYCKDCKMSTPPCDGWGRRCEYVGVVTDDHYCGWGKLKGGEA